MFWCPLLLLLSFVSFSQSQSTDQTDDTDDGPFTLSFCKAGGNSCKAACAKNTNPVYQDDTTDRFPNLELAISQDDLQRYHSLQQEYLVEFLGKPMWSNATVDLSYCGTSNVTAQPLMKRDRPDWNQEFTAYKTSDSPFKPKCLPESITATISFNVITINQTTSDLITDDIISAQFTQLQNAYQSLGISFQQGATTRLVGPGLRNLAQGVTAQSLGNLSNVIGSIRNQGSDQINIFIVEEIGDISCDGDTITRMQGFCTYPENNNNQTDGCFIDVDSLPGMQWRGKMEGTGDTLVHEIGHWFGLRNIFDSAATDDACHAPDSVYMDTPVLAGAGSYDTMQTLCCADSNGAFQQCDNSQHHITNWMSYSKDRGMVDLASKAYPWTDGQRAAMFASFYYFRYGIDNVKCGNGKAMYGANSTNGTKQISGLAQDLVSQPIHLLDTLKKLCSAASNEKTYQIDAISGNIVGSENHQSKFESLGDWRWLIIAVSAVAGCILIIGILMVIVRRKGKIRRHQSYVSMSSKQGYHELQQQRGLKKLMTVQNRSPDPASEPWLRTRPGDWPSP